MIQQIFVDNKRCYGHRRVSAELRRRGMIVNYKRVVRLMREDNLLAVQPKAFVVTTGEAAETGSPTIVSMSLRVAIPRRVGLHKSPLPFRQPRSL
ncbi:MAG: IS3 family transposase [Bryobacteraceae bacterium]|nr:IS3 family transposase [Bryobacteraceae bacterium]